MKEKRLSLIPLLSCLLIMLIFCFCCKQLVDSINSFEHYNRVYLNSITVVATVTSYDEYDDDGNTDYRSYVSYVVDDVLYENLKYEDKSNKEDLTPIGTEVEIQVSPENPEIQISTLRSGAPMFLANLLSVQGIFAALYIYIVKKLLSKNLPNDPDDETIKKDLTKKIYGNGANIFFILLAVSYALTIWRYSAIFHQGLMIIAIASFAIWFWRIVVTIQNIGYVNRTEYEKRKSVLISKDSYSSDDNTTYELVYRSADRTWKTNTTEKKYMQSNVGDSVLSIYLPSNKKKPILYYDKFGNAC